MQAIWETVVAVREERLRAGKERPLPKQLVVTLDNTTKQNKGSFVAAWLKLLVRQGVFATAEVMFLDVGHTHDKVDQFFSRIAIYLRTHNAPDRKALAKAIKASYKTKGGLRPKVIFWEKVGNVSGWFKEVGLKKNALAGCTGYQYFRFRRVLGKTVMQVRSHCRNVPGDDWRGIKEHSAYHDVFDGLPSPKFVAACEAGTLPPGQPRNPMQSKNPVSEKTREDRWNSRAQALLQTHELFPAVFPEASLRDCQAILALERSKEPMVWHWDAAVVRAILGTDVDEDTGAEPQRRGGDDNSESDKEQDDSVDEADQEAPWMWAGMKLPQRNEIYIVREDGEHPFTVWRVMHRCKSAGDVKRATSALPADLVPPGTKANDEVYGDLTYACEQWKLREGEDPVSGSYKKIPVDVATPMDSSWALKVKLTGTSSNSKLQVASQRRLQLVLEKWALEEHDEEQHDKE
jgi:hypothetical protein